METESAQVWSATTYAQNARFVSELGAGILTWLSPRPGERILDLGCGDGALTADIVDAGATVVGVDASADFVAVATARGLDARQMDGEALTFDAEFDAVFSNAALHWMNDAGAVVGGVYRALKPGGRFVAEFGGHGNVAAIVTALTALARRYDVDERLAKPWYFPSPDAYTRLLEGEGFAVDRIELVPRPTPLPTGLSGWLATFRAPFFDACGDARATALKEAEALLAPALRDDDGTWTADYVRLKVAARRPH